MIIASKFLIPLALLSLPYYDLDVLKVTVGTVDFNIYIMVILLLSAIGLMYAVRDFSYEFSLVDLAVIFLDFTYLNTMIYTRNFGSGYLSFHYLFIPTISYFCFKYFIRDINDFNRNMKLFVLSMSIFAPIAIIQTFMAGKRISVLGTDPIGSAVLHFTPMMYLIYTKRWRTLLGGSVLLLLFGGFFVAFARGLTLILLVTPLLYLFIKRFSPPFTMAVTFVSTLALVIFLSYSSSVFSISTVEFFKHQGSIEQEAKTYQRLTSLFDWKRTLFGRGSHFQQGFDRFLDQPILGHGIEKGEDYSTWHCAHIEWLVFGGIFGYILYSLFLFLPFVRSSRLAKRSNESACCLIVITALFINSTMNGIMHGLTPLIIFMMIGMNEALVRIDHSQASEAGGALRG